MSTNPTNPETLLGNKPLVDPLTDATHSLRTAKLMNSVLDRVQGVMHSPHEPVSTHEAVARLFGPRGGVPEPTTADLASLVKDLGEFYRGGDDGPIREPGDTMPNGDDAATDDIDPLVTELLALRKQVRQLEAEKVVARAWIAELLGGTKKAAASLARIELLHQEIARLRAEHEDDCADYEADERETDRE